MTGPIEQIREDVEESDHDKRLLVLVLLVLLVVLGAGIGTVGFPETGPEVNESTPAPEPVPITPTTPTPTPDDGALAPSTATPTSSETPTPTETRRNGDDDDDDRDRYDDSSSRVDLTVDGSTVLAQTSDLAPGHSGQNAVTFENTGDAAGRLLVDDTVVVDRENSLLDPEKAAGDDATTGELSGALRVRLSVIYWDGATEYLYGTSSGYVALESLAGANRTSGGTLASGERATVTLEWKLPTSTGNEVQSDGVEFDVDFVLRQTS